MIREIYEGSRQSYGSRRVRAELRLGRGERVSRKRGERLMLEAGIQRIYRRRARRNLVTEPTEEDLVKRVFDVQASEVLWVTDITKHSTREEKLYCAAVLDFFSRRIIGHSIDIRHHQTRSRCDDRRSRPQKAHKGCYDPALRPWRLRRIQLVVVTPRSRRWCYGFGETSGGCPSASRADSFAGAADGRVA
ncbi:IS3 family transposase [Actinomadura montaniterrae]|nr:IS3 family transposase [Actinomadura montaniterrae]